jgi:hypothetical protein
LALFQDKLPQAVSIQRARVSADTFDEFTDRDTVVVERSFACSASLPHPGTERLQQIGLWRGRPMIATGRFIDPPQVADKQSRAGNNFNAVGATPAVPLEMIAEALNSSFTQIMSRQTLSDGPLNDALR